MRMTKQQMVELCTNKLQNYKLETEVKNIADLEKSIKEAKARTGL